MSQKEFFKLCKKAGEFPTTILAITKEKNGKRRTSRLYD